VNFLQQQKGWGDTLVIIAYDDSDGWYDHRMATTRNGSATTTDALDGQGKCGDGGTALPGVNSATKHAQGRCGTGPRLPLLIVSPWAKQNYVDHTETDQTSILRLVEDLYLGGERIGGGSFDAESGSLMGLLDFSKSHPQNATPVLLDPNTGLVKK
jgi:phospholipase C